jgi:peptide chain release factor 2
MLGGEHDRKNAIVTIHPGAGGTESQDWAEMLRRMYLRWAEAHGYKVEWVEETPGEEAGLKSVTVKILGPNAFGWLKTEGGVHRLVRISPFDSQARRQTSFASVWVFPVIDDSIQIEILDKDLKIDTYRASGAGGQHVNRTESAVRITHLPTGLVVAIQDEKSQHKNRAKAMKILRARLYEAERSARDAERSQSRRGQVGSGDRSERIRTYNFPQNRVTDHRINLTLYKLEQVLSGEALGELTDALIAEEQAARLADVD